MLIREFDYKFDREDGRYQNLYSLRRSILNRMQGFVVKRCRVYDAAHRNVFRKSEDTFQMAHRMIHETSTKYVEDIA